MSICTWGPGVRLLIMDRRVTLEQAVKKGGAESCCHILVELSIQGHRLTSGNDF